MTTLIIMAVLAVSALLAMIWDARQIHRFTRAYRYTGHPRANCHECLLRFGITDSGSVCLIGADKSGLYLLSDPGLRRRWRVNARDYHVFRHDLFIPWDDIVCRAGRTISVRTHCIWFKIPSKGVAFFVSKDIGDLLREESGWRIP